MLDMSDVVNDDFAAQPFNILRSTQGKWVKGVWSDVKLTVPSYGSMQPTKDRDLDMVPEGDRVKGMFSFWSSAPIFTTGTEGTDDPNAHSSDIIIWRNQLYRVLGSKPWEDFGYWRAVGVRIEGE